jgi:hypothetical protein
MTKRRLAKRRTASASRLREDNPQAYDFLVEDVLVLTSPAYQGQPAVRAALTKGEGGGVEVHLLSVNEEHARAVAQAIASEGTIVRARRVDPPPPEEVQRWLGGAPPRTKALPAASPPPTKTVKVENFELMHGNFSFYENDGVTACDDCGATIARGRQATNEECNAHVCRQRRRKRT